jgi:hypothetical protein
MKCIMKRGFGGRQLLGYFVKYCPMLRMRSFGGPGGRAFPVPSRKVGNLKITPQSKPDSSVVFRSRPGQFVFNCPMPSRNSPERHALPGGKPRSGWGQVTWNVCLLNKYE